jgi:heat shock protein HslJ
MVSLGIGDDVIIEKILSAATTNFDTSVDGLKTLKASKVSDAVLKAMINPRGPTAVAQNAAARRAFAERVREEAAKTAGGNLPPGGNVSAEGPDATLFVYQQHGVTLSGCNALFAKFTTRQDAIPYLRQLGFTHWVCRDDANSKFAFDLASQGAQVAPRKPESNSEVLPTVPAVPKSSPPPANAQTESSGDHAGTQKLWPISGRVFGITNGGDLKPARLAHVYVLGQFPKSRTELVTAELVFVKATTDGYKELNKTVANDSEAVACHKELLIIGEALGKAAEWVQQNRMYSQMKDTNGDEEGKFHFSGISQGFYTIVVLGRAGMSDAYWEAEIDVGLNGKITDLTGGEMNQVTEIKLNSPKKACYR